MDIGAELYRRYLEGDEKAFEDLIKTYRTPLTLFINGFVKDSDAAENLMIDVFVELVRKNSFKGKSSLKTYLFAIGRNKALRYLKKRKQMCFVPLEYAENCSSSDYFFDDYELRKEAVREALRQIRPEYSEVIYLLYYENMSYKEAALVTKKSEKQIANLAYRGKQALKKYLEGESECI